VCLENRWYRLRIFENRVLRRIFGPKRDGVIAGWSKVHNEELHNSYFFAKYNYEYNDEVKENEVDRACNTHGGEDECI
jgi:hypothetical protein